MGGGELSREERLEKAVGRYHKATEQWEPFHRAMTEELDFSLKLLHYENDYGQTRRPGRIQPRSRRLKQYIKHVGGVISRSKIYLDVRPVDRDVDPEMAEIAKNLIEWEIYHPLKGYEDARDTLVLGALAARMWGAKIQFDPQVGPAGEIVFSALDGRSLMWASGFLSPHDLRCPWVLEVVRMPISEIRGMGWDNAQEVRPDDQNTWRSASGNFTPYPGQVDLEESVVRPGREDAEAKATIGILWERNLRDLERRERPGSLKDLAPDERFMMCRGLNGQGCGYRTSTQSRVEQKFPEISERSCPDCGGHLVRQDAIVVEEDVLAYRRGRRVTIFAPISGVELDVGPWPYDVRTVPYIVLVPDPYPGEPMGGSMTSDNWTLALGEDYLLREGFEQIRLARPYHMIPETGVVDATGEPWRFGEDQGLGIFYNQDMPPQGIHTLQAAGLPPAWNVLYEAVAGNFRENAGTSDMGVPPNRSRNIPVGTIQAMIESGEIPADQIIARLQRAESPGFGVLWDLIRATYSPARQRRLMGSDGRYRMVEIHGPELPYMDIIPTASPEQSRIDVEELGKWQAFAAAPRQHREFLARRLNLPASEVRRLEEEEEVTLSMTSRTPSPEQMRMPALAQGGRNGAAAGGLING